MGNGHTSKTKTRRNVKFRPLDDDYSTDSETEAGRVSNGDACHAGVHPWLTGTGSVASTRSSTPTVLEDGVRSCLVGEKDPYQANSGTQISTGPEGSDLPDYPDHEADITSDFKSTRQGPGLTLQLLQNKARLPESHIKDPHIASPFDEIVSGAGQPAPPRNSIDSLKGPENPRWQAFWRDVNERIQHRE